MLESAEACKAFLGPRSTEWGGNNAALASDKQIALVQRFIDEGK